MVTTAATWSTLLPFIDNWFDFDRDAETYATGRFAADSVKTVILKFFCQKVLK